MKVTGGMNYREWQKRNTKHFSLLTKMQQKQARNQGYCNIGWDKVKNSWKILSKFTDNITSLFEHKFNKGDLVGAIDLSMLEAEQAKGIARKAVSDLDANEKRLRKVADEALAKYPLL
jgi:hypothetical protein